MNHSCHCHVYCYCKYYCCSDCEHCYQLIGTGIGNSTVITASQLLIVIASVVVIVIVVGVVVAVAVSLSFLL